MTTKFFRNAPKKKHKKLFLRKNVKGDGGVITFHYNYRSKSMKSSELNSDFLEFIRVPKLFSVVSQ